MSDLEDSPRGGRRSPNLSEESDRSDHDGDSQSPDRRSYRGSDGDERGDEHSPTFTCDCLTCFKYFVNLKDDIYLATGTESDILSQVL